MLVVPTQHVAHIYDVGDDFAGPLMTTLARVAAAVKAVCSADGVSIRQNNEPHGGQDVFHLHFHVIHVLLETRLTQVMVASHLGQWKSRWRSASSKGAGCMRLCDSCGKPLGMDGLTRACRPTALRGCRLRSGHAAEALSVMPTTIAYSIMCIPTEGLPISTVHASTKTQRREPNSCLSYVMCRCILQTRRRRRSFTSAFSTWWRWGELILSSRRASF